MLQSPTIHVCANVFPSPTVSTVNVSDVVRATTIARLLYASPVWWGFATVGERKRLNGILRKLTLSGFLPADFPSFDNHCSRADSTRFRSILSNLCHVLHDQAT